VNISMEIKFNVRSAVECKMSVDRKLFIHHLNQTGKIAKNE